MDHYAVGKCADPLAGLFFPVPVQHLASEYAAIDTGG